MKKFVAGILTGVLALSLAACGKSEEKLVIGAANTPHAEILEKAEPLLEKEGIKLEIERYQDYVLPNKDLENGDLDANYFQHIPYLELQKRKMDMILLMLVECTSSQSVSILKNIKNSKIYQKEQQFF